MEHDERSLRLTSIADRLWSLSVSIAAEGIRIGARGLGIVADEARRLCLGIESADSEGAGGAVPELLEQLCLLSLNGSIESLAAAGGAASTMPLLLGELGGLTRSVEQLHGLDSRPLEVLPEPSEPSETCDAYVHLLFARSGGALFCENVRRVKEIVRYEEDSSFADLVQLRGQDLRLIRPRHEEKTDADFGVGPRQAIVVRAGWERDAELYAVAVDTLPVNAIARIRLARPAPFSGGDFEPATVREAWNSSEGQLIFLDWGALAARRS